MAAESKADGKARIQDVVEEIHDDAEEGSSGSEEDAAPEAKASSSTPSAQASTTKKKKKKKKVAKALQSLLKGKDKEVPQALVDEVLHRVQEEQGPNAEGADEQSVRKALEAMKIVDMLQGKSGVGGKNKKDAGDHKFWSTQPVPQIGEGPPEADGPIEPSKPREEVRQEPYPLPKDFQWSQIDMTDDAQLREVFELLCANYIEDDDATFRFQYTAEFLRWALMPPGWHKEWHIGVRVASNKKLVAFISGVPITLKVRENILKCSEINYLCVHKKLRSKRLTPVLIKEVTRQCNLLGVFQAIYTAGVILPTPVTVCRYQHRCINIPKLVDIEFTFVPRNMTLARMIRQNKVDDVPHLASAGLREMQDGDVEGALDLYTRYMKRFEMVPVMTAEDLKHQFLSGKGTGHKPDMFAGRRDGQVTWSYVVEDPSTHRITDFFTFYSLPSTIMNSKKHNLLEAGYLFYYATDAGLADDAESSGNLQKRLKEVIGDAVIVAKLADFDVFNCMTLMDNMQFIEDLKFGNGNGLLNFYLYNWRTAALSGLKPVNGVGAGKGVGVVML